MSKINHERRNAQDKVRPKPKKRQPTKQQREARQYALDYEGSWSLMEQMHMEAMFNDDWLPTPRQTEVILKTKARDKQPWKTLTNTYSGTYCGICKQDIPLGTEFHWNFSTKERKHIECEWRL